MPYFLLTKRSISCLIFYSLNEATFHSGNIDVLFASKLIVMGNQETDLNSLNMELMKKSYLLGGFLQKVNLTCNLSAVY